MTGVEEGVGEGGEGGEGAGGMVEVVVIKGTGPEVGVISQAGGEDTGVSDGDVVCVAVVFASGGSVCLITDSGGSCSVLTEDAVEISSASRTASIEVLGVASAFGCIGTGPTSLSDISIPSSFKVIISGGLNFGSNTLGVYTYSASETGSSRRGAVWVKKQARIESIE